MDYYWAVIHIPSENRCTYTKRIYENLIRKDALKSLQSKGYFLEFP